MNENDLRVIKTKKALHQALLGLLRTNTLESISVSALCREAGVNRGTFYLHYKDVGSLFDEHLHHLLKDLEESYYEPYRHVTMLDPDHLDPSTIRIFHHVKKYQPFYEIVFDKKSSLSYYYSLFEKIKGLMLESTSAHHPDSIDIPLVIAYQANAIMGLLIQWSEDGFTRSPEYMNEQLTNFLKLKNRQH
ncbi:TetR/AcrR family transcriptional regulator [Paenibacillus ihbetae]|uniref:Transcriptional regulator n=1 Tax=Paenibacillus ihbetae TaxID=1870820 RepID=A0A1B2DUK3_9BACL|nr:TetR/AcrR family transcriptional regulator [Paenibacillus ihbetae]ANY71390.1 transcriptional regulator [Paenibacillus ihbetae]OOC61250.1 TetR family transcriptional regulator [Paenibacillus ihbetae]